MKMKEMAFWERPQERLLREGADSLSTGEILALILRTGTGKKSAVELATDLLAYNPRGIRYLAECSPEELKKIKGIGEAKACQLIAAFELGKRLAVMPIENRKKVKCSSDIADLFMERLRYEKKEHFYCLLLNSRGEIMEIDEVSTGDLTSSQSHPREVFLRAVKRSAASIAFVHNHPSGDPEPSQTDLEVTERLSNAGMILGIPVIDHIVIGDGLYISMKARGMCDFLP